MAEKEKGNIAIICDNVNNLENIGEFYANKGYTPHLAVLRDSENTALPTAGELLADLAQKQIPIVAFVIRDTSMAGGAEIFSLLWQDAAKAKSAIG